MIVVQVEALTAKIAIEQSPDKYVMSSARLSARLRVLARYRFVSGLFCFNRCRRAGTIATDFPR